MTPRPTEKRFARNAISSVRRSANAPRNPWPSPSNANPHVGEAVAITLTVANLGAVDVNDAFIDAPVPAGLALGDQSNGPCVVLGSTIHCSFGHIGAGQSLTQTLSVTASSVGTFSSTGTAGSSVTDTNASNDARSLSVTVAP